VAKRRNAAAISGFFVFHRKPEGREDENDDGKGIRDKKGKKNHETRRSVLCWQEERKQFNWKRGVKTGYIEDEENESI
jgi:hypothetical protein